MRTGSREPGTPGITLARTEDPASCSRCGGEGLLSARIPSRWRNAQDAVMGGLRVIVLCSSCDARDPAGGALVLILPSMSRSARRLPGSSLRCCATGSARHSHRTSIATRSKLSSGRGAAGNWMPANQSQPGWAGRMTAGLSGRACALMTGHNRHG